MIKGEQIILFPTEEQIIWFEKCCGFARYIYNACKDYSESYYNKNNSTISQNELNKYFVKLKNTNETLKWQKELPCDILKQSCKDYCMARSRSFKKYGNGFRVNYKSKHFSKKSFYCDYMKTKILQNKFVYVSKIGNIKMSRQLPRDKKLSNPRISFNGKNWILSVGFEKEIPKQELTNDVIGIDVGLKTLVTTNTGVKYKNINNTSKLKKLYQKKKILQRKVSKKYIKNSKIQSKRYYKTLKLLNICITKIKNINLDYKHKITTKIVRTKPSKIVVEDIQIQNLMKNKKVSSAFQKAGLYQVIEMLKYKCEQFGIKFVKADRFYPSSKLCSCCGIKYDDKIQDKKWSLAIRKWTCKHCNTEHDRDINASINLAKFGIKKKLNF